MTEAEEPTISHDAGCPDGCDHNPAECRSDRAEGWGDCCSRCQH